jgi:hypothetical protein
MAFRLGWGKSRADAQKTTLFVAQNHQRAYRITMEFLILFFLIVFAFIALAPEPVTKAALAGVWVFFALGIVGQIIYELGRALLR